MDRDADRDEPKLPPDDLDSDEGLDEYDEEVAESFPASDPPAGTQP
ncbi:MAG: hypothetical protein JO349_08260 [Candidatus Eremiobacteraeota bacterium]|nr:hypothetical protein [Candidatus Eremiobacteraeota bacterium]